MVSCAGGKKKKAAKQTASEVIRYLVTVKFAASWEDCFLDHHSLRHYVVSLQKGPEPLTAGTVAEKIRQLKLAIEYIIYLSEDESRILKCTKVLHQLSQWQKSLRNEIKQHKAEVRIRSRAEVGSATNPKQFLKGVKVQEDIQEAFDNTTCTSQQHKLILAYVAANIIFTNAQRPGVVQHMSIHEYEKEDDDKGNMLIKVLHHKTSSSSGEADIVIKKNIDTIIQKYIDHIRINIMPTDKAFQDRLFLTHTGNEFRKISKTIKQVANNYGYDVPNAP